MGEINGGSHFLKIDRNQDRKRKGQIGVAEQRTEFYNTKVSRAKAHNFMKLIEKVVIKMEILYKEINNTKIYRTVTRLRQYVDDVLRVFLEIKHDKDRSYYKSKNMINRRFI